MLQNVIDASILINFDLPYINILYSFQVLGYEFDYDEFHADVHGKLPYDKLKPDPVLKQLLLSMPQRKIVCILIKNSGAFFGLLFQIDPDIYVFYRKKWQYYRYFAF